MKQAQLFYIYYPVEEGRQEVVGPYSLEQMTGMLREGLITDETPTCLDGEMTWQPLSAFWQLLETKEKPSSDKKEKSTEARDKKSADVKEASSKSKEKPAEKKEQPVESKTREKKPSESKPVDEAIQGEEKASQVPAKQEKPAKAPAPKMDRESAIQLGVGGALLVAVAAIAYFLSAADSMAAMALMIIGGLAALVAQSLVLAMVFDEGWAVFVMVMFLPFYDIYYFTSSLKKYMPYFYVKYFGLAVMLAAYFGLASVDPYVADHFRALFGIAPRH